MKVLLVGDSHTWMMSDHPSIKNYHDVKIGTTGFYSTNLDGHTVDFLWKTGMNANDAKQKNLRALFDEYKLCPCSYDFVVFGFGDMDLQFKYRVRTMEAAAQNYFQGVLGLMSGYEDKIIFRDPTTRLGADSDNYKKFMLTLNRLCVEHNLPDPISTMQILFNGSFELGDYIGHISTKDSIMVKKYIIDYLASIYN